MKSLYYIWLQQALGYGSKHLNTVLERFGDAENVYKADENLINTLDISSARIKNRLSRKCLDKAKEILADCKKNGISVITFGDEHYPDYLCEIPSPPAVLYVRGNVSLLSAEPSICIVGPRKVSTYGKKAAFSLAARLALCGFTIVSGGAIGCDTAAHKGALSVGGKTICVLGAGIASDYLIENKPLRDEIANKGLLISEYPPYHNASKFTFPMRNRLMAGLTLGTAVIEAGEKSGALITANAAAEQNRDVFVIPGNPTDPHYKGSNKLLRDGAKPLLELADIITEYLPQFPHKIKPEKAYSVNISMNQANISEKQPEKPKNAEKTKKIIQDSLSKNAKIVYNQLDKQIFYIDDICCDELTASQIIAALTELEIYGYIEAKPGGRYALK